MQSKKLLKKIFYSHSNINFFSLIITFLLLLLLLLSRTINKYASDCNIKQKIMTLYF